MESRQEADGKLISLKSNFIRVQNTEYWEILAKLSWVSEAGRDISEVLSDRL